MNLKELDYNCLNSFYELVTHRSLEKVSNMLELSELTLRRQIRKLETELGVTLLTSKKGFITCTKEAELLYHNIKIFFDNVEDVKRRHYETKARIGFSEFIGELYLKKYSSQFIDHFGTNIEFYIDSMEDLVTKLNNRQIDAVYGFNLYYPSKEIEYIQLEEVEMAAMVAQRVEADALQELFLIDSNSGISKERYNAEELGIFKKITVEGQNRLSIIESYVAGGVGVFFAPKHFYPNDEFKFIEISNAPIAPLRTQLVYRKDSEQSSKVLKICDFFRKYIVEPQKGVIGKNEFYPK